MKLQLSQFEGTIINTLQSRPGWDIEKAREEFLYFKMIVENGLRQPRAIRIDLCTVESVRQAIIEVVGLGLSLNPAKKQSYLIPYKDVCTLMVSYRGELDFLAKNGVIKYADVGSVREKDEFELHNGPNGPVWKHKKPRSGPRGKIDGAFCIYHLPDGSRKGDYFTNEEILKRKAVAKSGKFWGAWEDEMYIKTAVRMARNGLPTCQAVQELERIDNIHSELDPKFVDAERISHLKEEFALLKSKRALDRMYSVLNEREQSHPEIQQLYDQREIEIQELKALKS